MVVVGGKGLGYLENYSEKAPAVSNSMQNSVAAQAIPMEISNPQYRDHGH